MKIKNALIVYYVHNYKTLQTVGKALAKHGISSECIKRDDLKKKNIKGKDIVITVGGDGTFLRTAHMIDKIPILAVSSDERYNEAFFGRATKKNIEKKIGLLVAGKFKITKLPRLKAKINGKALPIIAVNEVFVGSKHPYHTSRYVIKVKGKSEFQKSSGVLIATKMGSNGWAKSAAKKKIGIPDNGFGYVVREAYSGRLTKPKMLLGHLPANHVLTIKSMNYQGIVVIDSYEKEFEFKDGAKLEVTVSKNPLNFVEF